MTRALVTGVAGFIGSHLAAGLLDRGYAVRGIDNFDTGNRDNVSHIEANDSFTLVEGDICDEDVVGNAMADVDAVFHQAAVPSVPRSIDDPVETTAVNCTGTATLLDAARHTDVASVVVASSAAVYGSDVSLPIVETETISPESPYALSKHYTEQLAMQYSDLYGLDTVALRYFNVFGPRQDPEGEYATVVPKFIELLLDGKRPVIYGDGKQSRDFVYVDDIVNANVLAAECDVAGETCNVAAGRRIRITELVDQLTEILGTDITPKYDDPRPGDIRHSVADISKARELLDYAPEVSFEEALERTVEWYRTGQ